MDLKGLKKKLKSLTKMQIYHIVCIGLCVISFVLSFIVFFPCVRRAFQGFVDIVLSIGHLFSKKVKVGVTKIPNNMDTVLPLTIEEFKAVCKQTGKNFINKNYVKAFLVDLVLFVFTLILIIAMLSFVVLVIVLCIKKMYKKVNINHNKDTKALLFWFKLQDKIYYPAKSFILNVWSFAKKKKAYIIVFLGIWSLNFNVLTIALEAVAFVLYFIKSFDMLNIFVQIAKLAVDINVLFRYMPIPIWMFIGYKIFHHIRKERGFEILEIEEMLTIEVLEDHPGDLLGTGKPRAGKTFLITYLQKLQAKMFRRTAKEKSFDRRMEFPFFPWILVEQTIIAMRNMDAKFCLGTLHAFIDDLEGLFVRRLDMDEETKRQELERLQGMGYQGHDFCFDYNYERYGLGYDNNAKIVYLFDCIHMYADHFYRYSAPTSNIFNNYPVRDYVKFIYFGNYPLLDEYKNELRVTTEELYEHSQYSHKYYFDMGRLGVLKDPEGLYVYNFEGGVIGISEAGKEYGNQKTNKEYVDKVKGEDGEIYVLCTPNTDLAGLQIKMEGHGVSVDGVTYKRRFMDEQRPTSIQADILEMVTEMRVLKRGEAKIKLPWFGLEERLYHFCRGKMSKILNYMLPRHGENTLLMYFVFSVYSMIHNHYVRIYNQFASREMDVVFVDHSVGEKIENEVVEKMYVPARPMTEAYATGYFSVAYKERRKRSKTGGNDQVPQYRSISPELDDMRDVGSHFYDKVLEVFNVEDNNKGR